MWIQLPDGRYGRVDEIVDLTELQAKQDALKAKKEVKQADIVAVSQKIASVKDADTRALLDKVFEEEVAPIVMLENEIDRIQGIIDEITQ